MTTVIETCRIPPPPGGAAELSLPLTYLDVTWIHFQPIRRLLFYDHPCSKPQFLDTIVPQLKQSLSLTLKHYLPVAGSLLYPSDTAAQKPVIRYVAGDSVPLTIAVSSNDFDHLTGNHPRDADQFYDFVPPIPPASYGDGCKAVPVFALQATLFPGRGICIGFVNQHVLGDASSIVGFVKAWASITKLGGDAEFLAQPAENRPVFDRGAVSDPHEWDMLNWEVMREIPFKPPVSAHPVQTNRVRATFVLNRTELERLKLSIKPGPVHVSSFVTATSYVWSCLAKSGDAVGEEAENGGVDYFVFVVDVRARADPPVPASYFGNCLSFAAARVERRRLAGEEGFAAAAEEVGRVIRERVNRKEEVLRGMQNWRESYKELKGIRSIGVSGSPKFDLCAADFGWGEARKMEVLSIDGERYSMSLCRSRGSGGGGLEVGLSLEKKRMEAFAAIFAQGLRFG